MENLIAGFVPFSCIRLGKRSILKFSFFKSSTFVFNFSLNLFFHFHEATCLFNFW